MLVVATNPSRNMPFSSWFYKSLCFFLVCNLFISSVLSSPSYTDYCASTVPESTRTHQTYRTLVPSFHTTYYTGGERLTGKKSSNQSYDYVGKSLIIKITSDSYETIAKNVYMVRGHLVIRSPYRYYDRDRRNFSYDGSYYRRRRQHRSNMITFLLNGYWSESSRKLCMVGSASWKSNEGKAINLDAVLKMSYNSLTPSMFTGVISGTLESTSSVKDSGYFEPISMFDFPYVPDYNYSLVSKELGGGHSGGFEGPKNQSLDLDSSRFCSVSLAGRSLLFELEHGRECNKPQTCSPLGVVDGMYPGTVSLYPIQCSTEERMIRHVVTFQNVSDPTFYQKFDLDATLIGEGSWDDKKNQLLIVACQILDPVNHFGNVIGDCSLRLSFRYPSVLTITNNAKLVGKIWTNKSVESVDDSGYFRNTNLSVVGGDLPEAVPGLKYKYTELDKVKKLCRVEKVEKKGNIYPDGPSNNMRFDMFVKDSNGEEFGWGFTVPLAIGNELYQEDKGILLAPESAPFADAVLEPFPEPQKSRPGFLNVSFIVSITPFHSEINKSRSQSPMQITAEGVYDSESGCLCMVGCRKLPSYVKKSDDSKDCEIVVNFQFAPINDKSGGVISGSIRSTRTRTDPLHFENMTMSSAAFYSSVAERSIWRMDLEITMILISNTFMCIFVGLQIFHVRRNPEVVSSIALVMLLILSLGYMIPLVLNFEALFLQNYNKQPFMFSSKGWLEANEVTMRVVIMVAFLLQIRLLQLVWTAKTSEGNEKGSSGAEKKAAFVSMLMYIFGGLLTLLLNWIKSENQEMNSFVEYHQVHHSLWGYLRSYAGLILDGFLLPQILLNTFSGSSAKALSNPFYIGTSAVRLVPHAYDQYRAHNFPRTIVNGTYYYANPAGDFYSTAWDVIIPCGMVALAVIVFLQQRHGGRWILPSRFRELELYEKVPVVNNEL